VTLGRRNILAALILALPAALIIFTAVNWLESRDRTALLERIAQSQLNEVTRDACQNDPQWFLAGPRTGRPKPEDRLQPDADVHLPRPSATELPFEYFAYDEEYSPKSVAGPRFPDNFKRQFRAMGAPRILTDSYTGPMGTGLQTAIFTGWSPGPCSYLLFRQPPPPSVATTRAGLFAGIYIVAFLVAWAAAAPTSARIRRLSKEAKSSSRQDYAEMVKITGQDEVSSLGAVFNDAAADIRRKMVDAADRETALRRYVDTTTEDVVPPMQTLEAQLASLAAEVDSAPLRQSVRETHRLMMQLQNLAAVTSLRKITDATPREAVELSPLLQRLIDSRRSLANAAGVRIDASRAVSPVSVQADTALMEQAVGNLLDNAIIYNRAGGTVRIELASYDNGKRFKLVIADDGPGVDDEAFAGLTANKRFRGDESRNRRPGSRGLGLALAREIADRFGLQLDLRQPATGGFEAEIATRT
jgi:signal transduction histidine kinase